jgi:AraC-like DNA-binding protein
MKPILAHYPLEEGESFFATLFNYPFFPSPWHYHPEYELVMIKESVGRRFIGDSLSEFKAGDLTLLGPNLPHLYRNAESYYQSDSNLRASSITIHFLAKSIGQDFLQLPQNQHIRDLLQLSIHGLDFIGETRQLANQKMFELINLKGLDRLLKLIEVLNLLAKSAEYQLITHSGLQGTTAQNDERLSRILEFMLQNFKTEIRLETIAELVWMTRTSVCRYFKERTKRNLWDFLAELRLHHAAQLLRESKLSILAISLESGFSNLSNFNRLFHRYFACSPRDYRNNWKKEM